MAYVLVWCVSRLQAKSPMSLTYIALNYLLFPMKGHREVCGGAARKNKSEDKGSKRCDIKEVTMAEIFGVCRQKKGRQNR